MDHLLTLHFCLNVCFWFLLKNLISLQTGRKFVKQPKNKEGTGGPLIDPTKSKMWTTYWPYGTHTYIYIYIYTYKKRERKKGNSIENDRHRSENNQTKTEQKKGEGKRKIQTRSSRENAVARRVSPNISSKFGAIAQEGVFVPLPKKGNRILHPHLGKGAGASTRGPALRWPGARLGVKPHTQDTGEKQKRHKNQYAKRLSQR